MEEEARQAMNFGICGADEGKLNRGAREERSRVGMRASFCKHKVRFRVLGKKR